MNKLVIKILQGNVVSQTVLGELTIHSPVANFLGAYSVHVSKIMKISWT